jgi:hypothetical protein
MGGDLGLRGRGHIFSQRCERVAAIELLRFDYFRLARASAPPAAAL